jgi:hypothetical protein
MNSMSDVNATRDNRVATIGILLKENTLPITVSMVSAITADVNTE